VGFVTGYVTPNRCPAAPSEAAVTPRSTET
jgi:hypothetical protein